MRKETMTLEFQLARRPSTMKVLSLAGWFFTRIYRCAIRTGLIARYSAETLG